MIKERQPLLFGLTQRPPLTGHAVLLLLFTLCMACKAPAQQQGGDTSTQNNAFITCDQCLLFDVDPLGQFYTVDRLSRLNKYNTEGKLMYNYTNRELGRLHSIDVSNPMKIFLFYRDLSKVIIVDNTLAEIQRFDLDQFGFQDVSAAGPSNDNQIWVFDKFSLLLMKLDQEGNVTLKSDPVQMLTASRIIPDQIIQRDTRVFINNFQDGLLIFDQYAQFMKNPNLVPGKHFGVQGDQVYFLEGKNFVRYSIKYNDFRKEPLPSSVAGRAIQVIATEEQNFYLTELGIELAEN